MARGGGRGDKIGRIRPASDSIASSSKIRTIAPSIDLPRCLAARLFEGTRWQFLKILTIENRYRRGAAWCAVPQNTPIAPPRYTFR